jgi:hypothetical protein
MGFGFLVEVDKEVMNTHTFFLEFLVHVHPIANSIFNIHTKV